MDAQFIFFNSPKIKVKPTMAGINYFLTHGARGGEGKNLLGEKRDVKAWLGWLELYANGDVKAIETPIGFIPKYEDLKKLFAGINKEYPKALYDNSRSTWTTSSGALTFRKLHTKKRTMYLLNCLKSTKNNARAWKA
jgi:GTP-dependent phosphoenolpyruvate carboxykinase